MPVIACHACGEEAGDWAGLEAHVEAAHIRPFAAWLCGTCRTVFPDFATLALSALPRPHDWRSPRDLGRHCSESSHSALLTSKSDHSTALLHFLQLQLTAPAPPPGSDPACPRLPEPEPEPTGTRAMWTTRWKDVGEIVAVANADSLDDARLDELTTEDEVDVKPSADPAPAPKPTFAEYLEKLEAASKRLKNAGGSSPLPPLQPALPKPSPLPSKLFTPNGPSHFWLHHASNEGRSCGHLRLGPDVSGLRRVPGAGAGGPQWAHRGDVLEGARLPDPRRLREPLPLPPLPPQIQQSPLLSASGDVCIW